MHGTVSPDNPGTARAIARDFASTSTKKSAHYIVDPAEVIQTVRDHVVAFHCGWNTGSVAVEMCDEQQGPASRWADADSKAIIARAATLVAELCLAYEIEARRPSVAELKAKGPHGIYGHNDSRLAFGNTTHVDPLDFPWDDFLVLVRQEMSRLIKGSKEAPVAAKYNHVQKGRAALHRALADLRAALAELDAADPKRPAVAALANSVRDQINALKAAMAKAPTK